MTGKSNELSSGETADSQQLAEYEDGLMINPATILFEQFGSRDFMRHRKPLKPPIHVEETGVDNGTIDNRT